MRIHCAAAVRAQLGEGPVWDAERRVIWWVDIRTSRLHRHDTTSGANYAQPLECRITALGLTRSNGLIGCGDRGFVRLSIAPDFTVRIAEVIAAPRERAGNRFNDGKIDARGRFWAGTMDDEERGTHGVLYRLQVGEDPRPIRTGIRVPNGPCFLKDGTVLTTDSAHRLITALRLDDAGEPVAEREFIRFTLQQGCPDGMTVDAENHIWVAFWDGWCLRRISPTGHVVQEVPLPVQRPTCPVFGGEDMRQLYVTSATTGLDADTLAAQPWAGGLLRLDCEVGGLPPGRFPD